MFVLAAVNLSAVPMSVDISYDRITDQVQAVATLRSGDDRLEFGCTPYEARRIWVRLRSHHWYREGNAFNGNIAFSFRFDDRPAWRMMWSVRERTAMLVGRGRVVRFVDQLLDARQLIVRAPGPEGRRYDLVFAIAGAREVIGRALEACGDPLHRRL